MFLNPTGHNDYRFSVKTVTDVTTWEKGTTRTLSNFVTADLEITAYQTLRLGTSRAESNVAIDRCPIANVGPTRRSELSRE
jgi:hypothetical protein